MSWYEVNFDGLVGPTHNFSGLSYGNLASTRNQNLVSFPQQAAFQGLKKMRMLHDLGIPQAVLPPQMRPDLDFLRNCGFHGSNNEVIHLAAERDPVLLAAASSSAFMWTANAATVSPAPDTADHKLHFTPANLITGLHRSVEGPRTHRILEYIFSQTDSEVHAPLPSAASLSDEGAANHMRLAPSHGHSAMEIFVYGRDAFCKSTAGPTQFPARQTLQASMAVARQHRLKPEQVLFWQQSSHAIDGGAFHNDVVAVANENVLFCHQDAFENQLETLYEFQTKYRDLYSEEAFVIEVPRDRVSLQEAVETYLFNSQLITTANNQMILIAPAECHNSQPVREFIEEMLAADNPVQQVLFPNVRQSMQNGGGPACLRLRVLISDQQWHLVHQGIKFTPELEQVLKTWVKEHYREQLSPEDLGDPQLFEESRAALIQLEQLLEFPAGLLVEN